MKDKIRLLAVLLFHNDEDIIEDQIKYYKYKNKHDLIVFIHNSNDNTSNIIEKYKNDILCIYNLTEKVLFKYNKVHEMIYDVLLGKSIRNKKDFITLTNKKYNEYNFSRQYDWISFPESDEFLEGPNRKKCYYEHLYDIHNNSKINKITFRNIIYWFTEKDDSNIISPLERIKYYCIKKNCDKRLYAWRGKHTIQRWFGHKMKEDKEYEIIDWKTRHYEMRSLTHMKKKLDDRKNISRGTNNSHYDVMETKMTNNNNFGIINSSQLHYDNGDEINNEEIFDWKQIY